MPVGPGVTAYPAALDAFDTTAQPDTDPAGLDLLHALAAIKAMEAELGINPSGSFATVLDRFAQTVTVRKTADQANTTTTLANTTDLAFPVAAGLDYSFRFTVPFSTAATTTGIGLTLTCPALAAGGYISATVQIPRGTEVAAGTAPAIGNVLTSGYITASADTVVSDSVPVINTVYVAHIFGTLSNCSAAGSLQLQHRSEVAASGATIKRGAHGVMWVT